MMGLNALDASLKSQFGEKHKKFVPNNLNFIHYLFFEKGIGIEEFNRMPIPYIMSMVNTHSYYKELELNGMKKK